LKALAGRFGPQARMIDVRLLNPMTALQLENAGLNWDLETLFQNLKAILNSLGFPKWLFQKMFF
jgi:hypothetical protein